MAIRPIDMQAMIQKAAEVRAQQNQAPRPEIAAQQFAQKLQKEVQQSDHQVSKTEHHTVDKDGGGKNGADARDKGKKRKKEPDKPQTKKASTSMFDISI